jgi:hypothetical protein
VTVTSTRALGRGRSGRALDRAWALLCGLLVLSAMQGWGLDGGRDWDEFQADLLSARQSLVERGELPFWMPYRAGGHDAWADPQSVWCSPLGILALVFGVEWGMRLFAAVCASAVALGGARLVAWLGGGAEARLVSGACLALAPPLACYRAAGVPTYRLGLAVLPWVVWGFLVGTRRGVVAAAALMALLLYGGGVNHLVFHGVFLAVIAAAQALRERQPAPLWRLGLLMVAAMALAAPKLLPAADLARRHPRPVDRQSQGRGAVTWALLPHLLLNRDLPRTLERPRAEFVALTKEGAFTSLVDVASPDAIRAETAVDSANAVATTGWLAFGFALLGVALAIPRLRRVLCLPSPRDSARLTRGLGALLPATGVLLWLAWGRNATPSLWSLLVEWPVFSSLRSPDKTMLYLFFAVALLAGLGAEALLRRLAPGRGPRALGLALVLGLVTWEVHPPARAALRQAFCEAPLRLPSPGHEFRQVQLPPRDWGTRYGPPVVTRARSRRPPARFAWSPARRVASRFTWGQDWLRPWS